MNSRARIVCERHLDSGVSSNSPWDMNILITKTVLEANMWVANSPLKNRKNGILV